MSTRSTTHFLSPDGSTTAIVYRHWDGYPEGAGADLLRFIAEVQQLPDSRIGDPSYLAAKYVVFLAREFVEGDNPLSFLGVGVVMDDPGDIEYRYTIAMDGTVRCYHKRYPELYPDWEDAKAVARWRRAAKWIEVPMPEPETEAAHE